MEISDKEVLRYLGYRGAEADERVSALIKELSMVFVENTVPKSVFGIWDCQLDSLTVALNGLTIYSKQLANHLIKCRRVALLAATLGPEADTLIRRYSVQDMEKALIAQAVGTVMIEAYCDKIESEIAQKSELSGLNRTTRFSPGYGDFDIAHQKDIVNLLNCDKRIGLALTIGYMLVPSKSVTAIIGFTEEGKPLSENCKRCAAKRCEFQEAE
jgi:hypothetical protein